MARKKSRFTGKSPITTLFWLLFTAVTGGGVSGYLNPDWPVVGSVIKVLKAKLSGTPVEIGRTTPSSDPIGSISGDIDPARLRPRSDGSPASTHLARSPRPADRLLIASFNIQVFGKSKLSKPVVTSVLASVVRQFDIVAIQEVRAKEDDVLPQFVAAVNADGSQYHYLIGPRLGRSNSTEQYAFVYDTTRVEYDPSSVASLYDPADMLHREPMVTRFRARTNSPDQAFTFWLVNIHTDPDEVPEEVSALADVFTVMQSAAPGEDDVILLGDLNASESQFGRLGQIPGMRWVVSGNVMTNTRKTKAYDNLLFSGQTTTEFTGQWGVFDLEGVFGLTTEDALRVSDHLPVWAEFNAWESNSRNIMAGRQGGYRR